MPRQNGATGTVSIRSSSRIFAEPCKGRPGSLKYEYTVAGQRWILTNFALYKVKKDYLKFLTNSHFWSITI